MLLKTIVFFFDKIQLKSQSFKHANCKPIAFAYTPLKVFLFLFTGFDFTCALSFIAVDYLRSIYLSCNYTFYFSHSCKAY